MAASVWRPRRGEPPRAPHVPANVPDTFGHQRYHGPPRPPENDVRSLRGSFMTPRSHDDKNGLARPTLERLEQRVLEVSAGGLSNGQVAEQLGIPVELVRAQFLAIFE